MIANAYVWPTGSYQAWQRCASRLDELDYEWSQLRRGWQQAQQAWRRYQLAQEHGWLLCLPGLQAELLIALTVIADFITVLRNAYQPTPLQELSQRHWYQEVVQLYDEFPAVAFIKEDDNSVSRPLPFAWSISNLVPLRSTSSGRNAPNINNFFIEALDANPANNNPDVIHPHVKDGELCAGDAKVALKAAIAQGRLADAFLLIQSVLQNYNPHSAYVKLEQWHGILCTDCSRSVDPEDSFSCSRCGNTLCDHCYSSCSTCSSTLCPGCTQGCAVCHTDCCEACIDVSEGNNNPLCRNCRTSCDRCGKVVGKDELDEDLCQACAEAEEAVQTPQEASPS
jgi:hypothetical protein